MTELRILANGMVGLGFSERGFFAGLDRKPHMIGCDGGTADTGPGPLGSGKPPKARMNMERDLRFMLLGARELGIPMIIGSCGGAGADPHLEDTRRIVEDIAAAEGLHFRLALVHAEQDLRVVAAAVDAGRIRPLGPVPPLEREAVEQSTHIVGMMGAGPLMEALDQGADVVLAGRCTDPAIFASFMLREGIPEGVAWHAAKSIDKGPLATTAASRGSPVLATVDHEGFTVEPTSDSQQCTVSSVAGITLHENPDPYSIYQPSGSLSTRNATYKQLDERRVRVVGSAFTPAERPSVKLEGSRPIGFRSILIAGIRDPRLLERFDEFLMAYREVMERVAGSIGVDAGSYRMQFRTYGLNGVMGDLEPMTRITGHEACLIVDVVADNQDASYALASRAGPTGSRLDPIGRLGGGGNFAYPFSLPVIPMGPVYEWSVWHLLDVDDESDPFSVELVSV